MINIQLMSKITSFPKRRQTYTDLELYHGLLSNNREKMVFLYREFYPKASTLLKPMGANEDAIKDIFQEAMVALWKNVQQGTYQVRDTTKLSTYFLEICKRQWWEKTKKAKALTVQPSLEIENTSEEFNFLDKWMVKEEMDDFRKKYLRLGIRCREMLRRFYFAKETMKQIAEVFSIGEATARNEKYRCMQRLKKSFQSKEE